jgi:hypothetical protein
MSRSSNIIVSNINTEVMSSLEFKVFRRRKGSDSFSLFSRRSTRFLMVFVA